MRSVAWLATYAALVLAPLLVSAATSGASSATFAVAFGAALGWAALGLLASEFALVTRVRAAAAAFGSDALLLFHRGMALSALVFVVVHAALLAPDPLAAWRSGALGRSGVVATAALLGLVASTIARRRLPWSYEAWLLAHRVLAVVVVAAMSAHAWSALAPDETAARWIAALYGALALGLLASQRLLRPWLLSRQPWEVVEVRDEGASTHTLVLRSTSGGAMAFAPGQFVWLATARRGGFAQEHPISIASSPELDSGRTIELAIKELGDWSREVAPALRPGDRVRVDGPFGAFTPDRVAAHRLVLIAGGVGVTPMRSMLLAMRDRGDRRPVTLFFAAHDRSRAMFAHEFETLRGQIDLELVFVFEAPDAGERCERGRVTADLLRRRLPADLRFTHFFVCGPTPMMEAVEEALCELGVPSARMHTERFDMV